MARRTAPWWVLCITATFVGYFALLVYCDIDRPEDYGYEATFVGRRLIVTSLAPDSQTPAGRAGLLRDDVIVAANGGAIESLGDWSIIDQNVKFGRPIHLTVERDARTVDRSIVLQRADWRYWKTDPGILMLAVLAVQCASLAVAVVIVFKRPNDRIALLGAWALATTAVYTIVPPFRFAAVWRALPMGVSACFLVPFLSSQLVPAVLFTFFASFPRRLVRSPRIWIALWAPMTIVIAQPMTHALLALERPTRAPTPAPSSVPMMAATAAYVLAGLAALVLNYRCLTDANERRRVRIVVAGAIAGLLPGLLAIASYRLGSGTHLSSSLFSSRAMAVGTISLLLFPASFAYAILRHRVFDIPVIIRQSVRYAVARGMLLSLVPLLGLVLVIDIVMHGNEPLTATVGSRAGAYVLIAGLTLVAHARRRQWLETLDRHFFREHYQTHRLLRQVVEDIGECADFVFVAPRVAARIEAALHPEFVALLVRESSELSYRSLVAAPAGLAPPPLRVDSTLIALLRVLRKPLEIPSGDGDWLSKQLPRAELDVLRHARIELLVPMVTTADHCESLLALGAKRSEEPYTQEDIDLLAIIAAHVALLAQRPLQRNDGGHAVAKECPQCGACYDGALRQCGEDGATLVSSHVPRVFARRYRLDRRLGDGGYGTVFEAFDTALDRRVAIKTIRDELVTRPDVATRFHREARLAAAFTHPNVVTVYDFGIDVSGGAFIVMELLHGSTLRDELLRQSRITALRALAIMRDVCVAMDAAHRLHLVHRDLKPENIFLIRDGPTETAKVLDFGVATALNDARDIVTEGGSLVGTLKYIAPAQLRGDDLHPSCDVWALGVIAYEMLTGSHPFGGLSVADISALAIDPLTAITLPPTNVPTRWLTLFRRVLALEPESRPDTPGQLFAELERALRDVAA